MNLAHPIGSRHGPWVLGYVTVLMFLLAATNGRPAWWASGVFVLFLAPLIIGSIRIAQPHKSLFAPKRSLITVTLLLWCVANFFGAVNSMTGEAFMNFLLRGPLPFLIYAVFCNLVLSRSDLRRLLLALALGCGFLFLQGVVAYVSEWGFPRNLIALVWARYDVVRMHGYMEVTLGNLSQMGMYIALVLPPLMVAGMICVPDRKGRVIINIACLLGLINLIVSGSRTAIVLILAAFFVALIIRGARGFLVALFGAFLGVMLGAEAIISFLQDPDVINRFLPSLGATGLDNSAIERIESIEVGIENFLEHPLFGVGPGMSYHFNSFFIPHQSFVHQLAELGLFGGLVYIWMTFLVVVLAWNAFWAAVKAPHQKGVQFLWLFGPAAWLAFGVLGGTTFTAGFSLVWIGLFHAMLALSTATYMSGPENEP